MNHSTASLIFCFLWVFSLFSCAANKWNNQKLNNALTACEAEKLEGKDNAK